MGEFVENILDGVPSVKALAVAMVPGVMAGYWGKLAFPFILLVVAGLIDYATGIAAAGAREQKVNSKAGLKGIIKKVCMWLLVAVGILVDMAIWYMADAVDPDQPLRMIFACVVCIWLLANELLSILENVGDMGIPVPGFLKKIIEWIKKKAEDEGAETTPKGDDERSE